MLDGNGLQSGHHQIAGRCNSSLFPELILSNILMSGQHMWAEYQPNL